MTPTESHPRPTRNREGLVVAAVVRLRHTQPDAPRPYRIPGGLPGVRLVLSAPPFVFTAPA